MGTAVDSFQQIYLENYQNQIKLLSSYCFDLATAEDILQETYLKAWMMRETFSSMEHFLRWMHTVAKNLALSKYRASKRETELNESTSERLEAPSYEEAIETERRESKASGTLLTESHPTRAEVARLHYIEGLKVRQISTELGLSQNTILSHLKRFREKAKTDLTASLEGVAS